MHKTAMAYADLFFRNYATPNQATKIVEIGSLDVNGSLRDVAPKGSEYIGLDFEAGRGVDMILRDAYSLPLADGIADFVVSTSCFEHAQFFWLTFLEALRILKPSGILYINVPSNGYYHRYPTDNWRFYPDAGLALCAWAQRNGLNTALLESFIGVQDGDVWNDFIGVFVKDRQFMQSYPSRMHVQVPRATNVLVEGSAIPEKMQLLPQDIRRWRYLDIRQWRILARHALTTIPRGRKSAAT